MTTESAIALAGAVVAALGLCLAYVQFRERRNATATEAERLAQQSERLRTALSSADTAVAMADLIVQRSKDPDVTLPELGNLARAARATGAGLVHVLAGEAERLSALAGQSQHLRSQRRS